MAVVNISMAFDMPANAQDALVEAFCGKYGYPNMVLSGSGLIPNPQSSGDFTRTVISGFCTDTINNFYLQKSTGFAVTSAVSGVAYVLFTTGSGIGAFL